ncbi:MAG: putative acetyltransferase [Podoviridae sp. cty5g4]|nr:MAG: putative acetyltransferase [Podoviridae sp. cty5g4]
MIYKHNLFGRELIGWKRKWIILKLIHSSLADEMIAKNHYSGKITKNRFLSMGIYHIDMPNILKGCIQLGYGIRPKIKHTWGDDVTYGNSVEFDRMWLSDELPKFSETIVLSLLAKYLYRVYPKIKYILTYSDGTVGNEGTIYKAGNYIYCGKLKADFYILQNGERIHPVTMWHRHKSRAWELIQQLYPGVKKANGFQYRFKYTLR